MIAARRAYLPLAAIVAVLILVQAVLAGRALFGSWSIRIHEGAGNATFALSALLVAAVALGRAGRHAIVVAAMLVGVLTAQTGLGYAGRSSSEAAAWHIPNGVLAAGLAAHQLSLAWWSRRRPER